MLSDSERIEALERNVRVLAAMCERLGAALRGHQLVLEEVAAMEGLIIEQPAQAALPKIN